MNKKEYDTFLQYLKNEDKDQALLYVLGLLDQGKSVVSVYEELLIPSLVDFECEDPNQELCVWYEHTRTSIIRTILEASYAYIIKEREQRVQKRVLVVCPQEEYHEIGAIIANHYFSLVGFDSYYVGANTPNEDILLAIKALTPDYIAISVTNYYNVIVTKKLSQQIQEQYPNLPIILGGQAFQREDSLQQVQHHFLLQNYHDIVTFKKEVIG